MKLNFSSRGLLVEDGKVLFVEYTIEGGNYFALPGGSLEVGESIEDCVKREFLEEVGIAVSPKELILVNEFIDENPKYAAPSWKQGIHQIETIFEVERTNASITKVELKLDFGMEGFRWLSKAEMEQLQFFPEVDIDWFFDATKRLNYNFSRR